jgi:hypothetical protein
MTLYFRVITFKTKRYVNIYSQDKSLVKFHSEAKGNAKFRFHTK